MDFTIINSLLNLIDYQTRKITAITKYLNIELHEIEAGYKVTKSRKK